MFQFQAAGRAGPRCSRRSLNGLPKLLFPSDAAQAPPPPTPCVLSLLDELQLGGHSDPKINHLLRRASGFLKKSAAQAGGPATSQNRRDLKDRVFCNNYVNVEKVRAIGFDYDYTLAMYNDQVQHLIYDTASRYLVDSLFYPKCILARTFDPSFAVRGLAVDRRHGLLVKLSHQLGVAPENVYRGRHMCSREEVKEMYGHHLHITPQYRNTTITPLNDQFSLAEGCLLADTVQAFQSFGIDYDPSALVSDVQSAIRYAHVSGIMHDTIQNDPAKYVKPAPKVRQLLEELRFGGKSLFLASNSAFPFVNAGMTYLIGADWRDLFEIVIVMADKPQFFTTQTRRPFREIDIQSGGIKWSKSHRLLPGKVYSGGGVKALQKMTGWQEGGVLYFGDSLWADLVRAAHSSYASCTAGPRAGAPRHTDGLPRRAPSQHSHTHTHTHTHTQ